MKVKHLSEYIDAEKLLVSEELVLLSKIEYFFNRDLYAIKRESIHIRLSHDSFAEAKNIE